MNTDLTCCLFFLSFQWTLIPWISPKRKYEKLFLPLFMLQLLKLSLRQTDRHTDRRTDGQTDRPISLSFFFSVSSWVPRKDADLTRMTWMMMMMMGVSYLITLLITMNSFSRLYDQQSDGTRVFHWEFFLEQCMTLGSIVRSSVTLGKR